MKQPYQAPTLIANGDLAAHTRTAVIDPLPLDGKPNRKNASFGDVGFGL